MSHMNYANVNHVNPLLSLYGMIQDRLNQLPAANPFTVSRGGDEVFEENREVARIVEDVCRSESETVRERMNAEFFEAGPLETTLADPEVTEIIVNGGASIWFEKHGKLHRLDDAFCSNLTYRNFLARLGRESGAHASLDTPFADGQWRGCRVHLAVPPASGEHAVLTLRRHPANPWTLAQLACRDWATPAALDQLKSLVATRKNFLIAGGTGSGKTSVLNACLQTTAENERSVLIEDTSELHVPNAVSTKLLTRRDANGLLREVNQSELVRQALRMRPDRIVMGEIRGPEAKDLLMAFATGHAGCMGTLHADSARQALIRLEMLIQLGAAQWNLHAVRTLIHLSVHSVVVVGRNEAGERRLEGIYRVSSLEDVGFLLERTA